MAARDDEMLEGVPACSVRDDILSDGAYPYTVWDTWLLGGVSVCGVTAAPSLDSVSILLESGDKLLLESGSDILTEGI